MVSSGVVRAEPFGGRVVLRTGVAWFSALSALLTLSLSGALRINWSAVAYVVKDPLNRILNPDVGPQALLLNGSAATAGLLLLAGLWLLRRRRVGQWLGNGILTHLRWLGALISWPAVFTAIYFLASLDNAVLQFRYYDEPVMISLFTAVTLGLLACSCWLALPRPDEDGPRPLRWALRSLMVLWSVAFTLHIDRSVVPSRPTGISALCTVAISLGLSGLALAYCLLWVQVALAHWRDLRAATVTRQFALLAWSALRALVHLVILFAPIWMGVRLGVGVQLSGASRILDRNDILVQYRYPYGDFRLPLAAGDIPPTAYEALEAIEDPGACTSPATHLPYSPQSIGRNLMALMGNLSGSDADFTGGSGVASQVIKNFYGRRAVDAIARWTRLPTILVTGVYKLLIEIPASAIYERMALLAGPDASPCTLWLNLVDLGRHQSYGIEAASLSYFDKHAADLTDAEAIYLVSRAQSPYQYDPALNEEAAQRRFEAAVDLAASHGYLTWAEAAAAKAQPPEVLLESPYTPFSPGSTVIEYAMEQLAGLGFNHLSSDNLTVTLALDVRTQGMARQVLNDHQGALTAHHVHDAAAVVIDPGTGDILAMVGNMAVTPRQTGSTVKPFVYLALLERGGTAATLFWDYPHQFPDAPAGWPTNYDGLHHGPILMRSALALSLNVPAVLALEEAGTKSLVNLLQRAGITNLPDPRRDGLAMALGAKEMTLMELTGAYAMLANGGKKVIPTTILEITDRRGKVLYRRDSRPVQAVRPEHAFIVTSMLADNDARAAMFGANSPLQLSRPAAAKTGTSNEARDNLAVGYTPDLVAGVWVGNASNAEAVDTSGLTSAAPIWHDLMEQVLAGESAADFPVPPGIVEVEVCSDSGAMPDACGLRRLEYFVADQLPLGPDHDWWRICPQRPEWRTIYIRDLLDEEDRKLIEEWAQSQGFPVGECPAPSAVGYDSTIGHTEMESAYPGNRFVTSEEELLNTSSRKETST